MNQSEYLSVSSVNGNKPLILRLIRPYAACDAEILICHCPGINNIHLWLKNMMRHDDATQVLLLFGV